MNDEELTMYCRHCWNPVERIQYREDGARTGGDTENVWKHRASPPSPPICSKSPITDEDVIAEADLP